MNPLGNGNILPPQLRQNIQQIKQMMNVFRGDTNALIQQNPILNQVMQTYKGRDPQQIFNILAKEMGVNPEAFIRELRG